MFKVKAALIFLLVVGSGAASLWLAPPEEQRPLILPVFGVIFAVGLWLIWWVGRAERRPFEQIAAGVHEVLGGNLDHEFPSDYPSESAVTLAQNLNLMMSAMLGKPARTASGSSAPKVEIRQTAHSAELVVHDIPEPAPPAMMEEPAEPYMRRIYDEYRRGAGTLGATEPPMTWVRFVEFVVRSERRIKQAQKCQNVRFRVEFNGGRALLIPMASE